MKRENIATYTIEEEIWNASTHAFGAAFSIVALAVLVTLASIYASAWSIVSCAIFGASMLFAYTASTCYHAIPFAKAKKILKKIDHIAIYYLIAGSYTPFLLVCLRIASPTTAWIIFAIIWSLAIAGTLLKILTTGSGTKFWSIALYLSMGWLIIFAAGKLFSVVPTSGIIFLVLGGLFYTGGVAFYILKSKKYFHAVWHIFVLLGTIMHFFSIMFSCVFA